MRRRQPNIPTQTLLPDLSENWPIPVLYQKDSAPEDKKRSRVGLPTGYDRLFSSLRIHIRLISNKFLSSVTMTMRPHLQDYDSATSNNFLTLLHCRVVTIGKFCVFYITVSECGWFWKETFTNSRNYRGRNFLLQMKTYRIRYGSVTTTKGWPEMRTMRPPSVLMSTIFLISWRRVSSDEFLPRLLWRTSTLSTQKTFRN